MARIWRPPIRAGGRNGCPFEDCVIVTFFCAIADWPDARHGAIFDRAALARHHDTREGEIHDDESPYDVRPPGDDLPACRGRYGRLGRRRVADRRSGRVLNRVDEKVYGHFLEHIYHSCNGGLWGELVWDRSFEGGGAAIAWRRQDDCIAQQGDATNVRLMFGSPQWSDYEFTVDARKKGGEEGFLILVRAANEREFYWANLGGWQNVGHALERGIKGEDRWHIVGDRRDGRIETGRWYRIRVRCAGPHIQVWLDDDLVIDYTDDGKGPPRGKAGVGTWNTQAQFKNFKVTSLTGENALRRIAGPSRGRRTA